jgi:alpha-tubulin suppressor-like RCC1 family protein
VDVGSVAIGTGHGCALTDARELYCWGSNAEGQVGVGNVHRGEFSVPQRVELPGAPGADAGD